MGADKFNKLAMAVLAKYKDTSLKRRWDDAVSFGDGAKALAFWIRDSEDVVNIVWLCPDGIRDITLFRQLNQSTLNFLILPNINAVEVREGANIAKSLGYNVNGDFIVQVIANQNQGTLVWISETTKQEQDLRAFLSKVFTSYLNASQ